MGKTPVAGLDRDSAREPFASCFYRRAYPVARGQHAVERTYRLFAQTLNYPLPESVGGYSLDHEQLADADPGTPYLVLLHGITRVTKYWPEAYWHEPAERVCGRGWSMHLSWSNAAERERTGRLAAGLENAAVLPRLSLAGMAKVPAGARTCVAVDTSLNHPAVALGVPTLSLFGPTNPGFTSAYGHSRAHPGSDFPCAPRLEETCIYQLTGEDHRLLDLKREQSLCFTQPNPQCMATRLEAMLLAPRTLR